MSDRRPFIAGNWKMHKTLAEAQALARGIRQGVAPDQRAEVGLGPAFTAAGGIVRISAGNYGGKLGKYHFHLHEVMA